MGADRARRSSGPGERPNQVDSDLAQELGERLRSVQAPATDPSVRAARRAGGVLRSVIDRLTATSAPQSVLDEATVQLEQVARLLEPYDAVRRYEGVAEASGLGHDQAFFDWSPLLGLANPLAPPVRVAVEDGIVIGSATFGLAYEGPPGCVHGGYVAAAFDEVLGVTQSLSGQVGMTGTLGVKYRRPTPLNTELRFEGRVDRVEGRKVVTSGRLLAGDMLTAEATGLFVAISPERFRAESAHRDHPRRESP